MIKPLDDITVIEIDNWMAAPSAGAILADLGARVIKVEPLTGDPMRNMTRKPKVDGAIAEHDFQFDVDNRGKESMQVDLTRPEAVDLVKQLCAKADVFLCNLLIARQQKFGLDPDSMKSINPRMVHATLTGYGTTGPDAWRPGYDVTAFFGRSGLSDASRDGDDGIPPQPRTAQGDHTTGLALVGAILAALRLVDRTGEFQSVETSLFETAVWTQASDFAATLVDEEPLRRRRRNEMLSATANRFPCKDGKWIALNMPEPKWWGPFATALGKPEWASDERWSQPRERYRGMSELLPMIDGIMLTRTQAEWGEIFDEHRVVWGPVQPLHEVTQDHQAEAINLFPAIEMEGVGDYRTVRIPMQFHNVDILPQKPCPQAGEHTEGILSDLGYSIEEIDSMVSDGLISRS